MFTTIDKAIVGALMAIVMTAQHTGVAVPEFMTESWAQGISAVLTPLLVYILPNKNPDPLADRRIRSSPVAGLLALALGAMLLTGCAGTRQAYQAAEGVNETAKVVAEHYYSIVQELNRLDDAGALTPSALSHTQDLVRKTRPLIVELGDAGIAYETVTEAIAMQDEAADAEDEAAMAEAEAALEAAIAEAAQAVSDLIDALDAAAGGDARLERMREDLDPFVPTVVLETA